MVLLANAGFFASAALALGPYKGYFMGGNADQYDAEVSGPCFDLSGHRHRIFDLYLRLS